MIYKSLNDIILSLKEPSSSSCEICSYENEKIKTNSFYATCKQTIIKNFIFPEFLCFIFDLSDEFEPDNRHFINLIKLKNNYRPLLKEEFILDNQKYILIGTINQSKVDHYIKNINPSNNLEFRENYFYDDFVDNNKIKEIKLGVNKNIFDSILDYHPLILFYVKSID